MRILEVIASADPASGGPIEGARQIEQVLRSLGHEITMISMDDPADGFADAAADVLIAAGRGWGTYGFNLKLQRWLDQHIAEFDVVLINGLWQFHGVAVWRAARRSRVPYFVLPHGMLDPWFRRAFPLKHLKKSIYWRLLQHRVLKDAKSLLFTCEQEKILARESFTPYRVRECVLGYGTACPTVSDCDDGALFRSAFPEVAGKRVLLFLGRIHRKKGCDLLIDAFAKFAGAAADVHLVIAGPDSDHSLRALQSQVGKLGLAQRVTWTGMLTGRLKWSAFRAAHVFCLPSHQENFGIAVAEALALGTPVLISDKVNIWREIEAAGAGFAGPDSVEGTEQLLRHWLALDEVARRTMSRRAMSCFATHFDVERVGQRLAAILQQAHEPTIRATDTPASS